LAQVVQGKGMKRLILGGQEVKDTGHVGPNTDLEAQRRHHEL